MLPPSTAAEEEAPPSYGCGNDLSTLISQGPSIFQVVHSGLIGQEGCIATLPPPPSTALQVLDAATQCDGDPKGHVQIRQPICHVRRHVIVHPPEPLIERQNDTITWLAAA